MSKTACKPKLIIVEGAQGTGKTTLTNSLRESIRYTQLLRLSGNGDSSADGVHKSMVAHIACLDFIYDTSNCGLNYVLDRSYLSELVYSMYNGDVAYSRKNFLDKKLHRIANHYDVTLVLLTASEEALEERLVRDKPEYNAKVKFNAENSLRQQEKYIELGTELVGKINLGLTIIDTSHRPQDEVFQLVLSSVMHQLEAENA